MCVFVGKCLNVCGCGYVRVCVYARLGGPLGGCGRGLG